MTSKSVLVVEDDVNLVLFIETALRAEGFDVVEAADGEEGEKQFKSGRKFDVVLTDVQLPKLTGDKLFYRLQAIEPDVKVIASSGNAAPDLIRQLLRDGLCAFIPKPYRTRDLVEMVRVVSSD